MTTEDQDKDKDNEKDVPPKTVVPDETDVQTQIKAAIADIKGKLDGAYAARDAATAALETMKQKEADAAIKALEAEGKEKEAFEAKLAQRDVTIKDLQNQVVTLTRDTSLRTLLAGQDFRTPAAADMAFKSVQELLTQDDSGNWVGKDGSAMEATAKSFLANPDYAFLLKPKGQSGSGFTKDKGSDHDDNAGKSAFDLTTEEVLARASENLNR